MNAASRPAVLRNVALHEAPRALGPHAAEPPAASPREAALRRAYELACARGLAEGLERGREQGLADARARIEASIDDARRALEDGAAAARERQAREHAAALARVDGLLRGLEAAVAQRLAALEPQAVALAYGAVCAIVGAAAASPERLAQHVSHAMQGLRAGPALCVRLGEPDFALLSASDAGRALMARHAGVTWRPDATLRDGDCVLDTAHGGVDASLGVQLQRLAALWTAAAAASSAGDGETACRP